MSDQVRCRCQRCTVRSLKGPVIIVTIGLLFLLSELRGGYFDFWGHTWPAILIVIGLLSLASAFASAEGHVSPAPPIMQSAPAVPPPPPPAPTSYPGQGQ